MSRRPPPSLYFLLFTVSGFAGLIYQSIWSHYLQLFLGHAAYAQTLVLAIFMGGMAIGAWAAGRWSARFTNLLRGYAAAELGIGLLALAFHPVFVAATGWAYDHVLPGMGGAGVAASKWGLASALILPASILLGTTFPLMSAGVLRAWPGASGRSLAMLYFTNSLGAAVGVLASGFVLIDRFGLPGTLTIAGFTNIALAAVVWLTAGGLAAPEPAIDAQAETAGVRPLRHVVLALAFVTGAASFVYEVTWIRMLSMGLGASTQAFEVMLAAFILGMALGAFWFRNRLAVVERDVLLLAVLLFAKAAFALYALWAYGSALSLVQWVMGAVSRNGAGYAVVTLVGFGASALVMLPTAFCAGVTLPLATRMLGRRGAGERAIGQVYAVNTAGCIVGAIFATHVGMELLGIKGLTVFGAFLDFAMAAAVLLVSAQPSRRARIAAGAFAAIVAVGLGLRFVELDPLRMSSAVFRTGKFLDPRENTVRFYKDGKTATVAVVDQPGIRSIMTNGKPDASLYVGSESRYTPDESTATLAVALPYFFQPGARTVANIGFGSGLSTHVALGSPVAERVDTIEIEPQMIEGARAFLPRVRRGFEDPRNHFQVEDAKAFFAAAGRRYDVVVSEPSNPWVSGVATLFSEEWYAHVKRFLKDDGLFVQWLQAYEIDSDLASTVFNALGRQFGDYAVYSAEGLDLLVVATPAARLPALQDAPFAWPGLREDLERLGYRRVDDLRMLRVSGRRALEPLFALMRQPANSDYFPILDQRAGRARFSNATATDLFAMRQELVPVLEILDTPVRTRLDAGRRAQPVKFTRLESAINAAALLAAARGAGNPPAGIARDATEAAMLVRTLAADCGGVPALWLEKLGTLVKLSGGLLEPAEMAPLFEFARGSRCARGLGDADRLRLAFLESIADGQVESMRVLADRGLATLPPERRAWRLDYAMAAMAGHLAAGKQAAALAVIEQQVTLLTPAERDTLALRLLVGHALSRAATTK